MDIKDCIAYSIIFGGFSAIGAATAITVKKIVLKYGYSFTYYHINADFGIQNMTLLAVIGTIQNVAPLLFFKYSNNPSKGVGTFIFTHLIITGALIGLMALAAKTHLIANRLTLFTGAVLMITSCLENISIAYLIALMGSQSSDNDLLEE